jgi:hypothetical protein
MDSGDSISAKTATDTTDAGQGGDEDAPNDFSSFDAEEESEDSGDDGTVPATAEHLACQSSCDVTAAVSCRVANPDCLANCEALLAIGRCTSEILALLRCQAAVGPSAYFCYLGLPVLMPGVCQPEGDDRAACRSSDGGV